MYRVVVVVVAVVACVSGQVRFPTPPQHQVPETNNGREMITNVNATRRQSGAMFEYVAQQRVVNTARSTVTIKVNSQTSLFLQPSDVATLYFDVTNNNNYNTFFHFYCSGPNSFVQSIQPYEKWIAALDTVTVRVMLRVSSSSTNTETVTFAAGTPIQVGATWQEDTTLLKAYLYIGQQVTDSTSPDVSYTVSGDCRDSSTPSTCSAATWGIQATIQDRQSGLMSVETVPTGFVFTTDFTAGTRDQMSGRYSASCCVNKVDLIAIDVNGNMYKTSIDINNVWLSAGSIAAIILASILLLLIIIAICCAIGFCIRRRRNTSTFTMHS